MATVDSYTKLLIHSDTTDGSIVFTDSSLSNHTLTRDGSIDHITAQSKFGATSIDYYTNNSSAGNSGPDFLTVSKHADFEMGSAPFTIDCWVYLTDTDYTGIFAYNGYLGGGGEYGYYLANDGSSGLVGSFSATGEVSYNLNSGPLSNFLNTWHHVALVRDGGNLYLFWDGEIVDSRSDLGSVAQYVSAAQKMNVGCLYYYTPSAVTYGLHGYIDEFRVSKGIARWVDTFDPPAYPYASTAYVVQGNLNDSAEVIVINESDWTVDNHDSESTGAYEVATTSGSKLVAARRNTDGEVISYGSVDSKLIDTPN